MSNLAIRIRPLAAMAVTASFAAGPIAAQSQQSSPAFNIPVQYHKMPNGLKVVLSPDRTAPTATVAVYYGVGLRNEPRNRTGFAHLFEHMTFQGSENLGKNEFINLENYVKRVQAVIPAEVTRIASTYLRPDQMTIVVVGDRSKVASQLEPYGLPQQ